MPQKILKIQLKSSKMLAPQVKEFHFSCSDCPDFDFIAGQFISLQWQHEGRLIRRSYSLANSPGQGSEIVFAAAYVANGPASERLFHMQPGDTLEMTGPFGRLILPESDPGRYLFLATSTGITPYHSMLSDLEQRMQNNPALQILLIQGVRSQADLLYSETFEALSQAFPQFQYRRQYSREQAGNLRAGEYLGYIQSALPNIELNADQDRVYLCGNPGMIDACFDYLKNLGFAPRNLIREKYISSK